MSRSVVLGVDHESVARQIAPEQRSTHMHVIGASGQGKSKFLEYLIRQDIEHRHGVCVIDPHGALYEELTAWCAYNALHRRRRIHLLDPNDPEWTIGFDPLRCDDREYLARTVDGAVEACAQVWGGEDSNRTPLLKKCLRAVFYALAAGGHTLGEALALTSVSDLSGFRAAVTAELDDDVFQVVWDDLNSLSRREFTEAFASTNNRLIEFLASPTIRRMLSLKENTIDIRACMDEGHIVLVNLQPRKISNDNARLIGTLLTNSLFQTAIRRDAKLAARRPFYLYIDECYQFFNSDVEAMLDQTRKFGLHLTLAHQHLGQLRKYGDHIYSAVMTNARTKVVFGGASDQDAEYLAKELLRETFDYNRPKEILNKPVVVGYERTIMRSRATARGAATSAGESSVEGTAFGSSSASSFTQTYGPDGSPLGIVSGGSQTAGLTQMSTSGHASMWSNSTSVVVSEGEAEVLQPVLEVLPTTLEGQDEILHRATLALRKLPKRAFVLAQPEARPALLLTPTIAEPTVGKKRILAFGEGVREKSPFMVPLLEADRQIAARLAAQSKPGDGDDEGDNDPFSVPEA